MSKCFEQELRSQRQEVCRVARTPLVVVEVGCEARIVLVKNGLQGNIHHSAVKLEP
jgi:hypothetical protein